MESSRKLGALLFALAAQADALASEPTGHLGGYLSPSRQLASPLAVRRSPLTSEGLSDAGPGRGHQARTSGE